MGHSQSMATRSKRPKMKELCSSTITTGCGHASRHATVGSAFSRERPGAPTHKQRPPYKHRHKHPCMAAGHLPHLRLAQHIQQWRPAHTQQHLSLAAKHHGCSPRAAVPHLHPHSLPGKREVQGSDGPLLEGTYIPGLSYSKPDFRQAQELQEEASSRGQAGGSSILLLAVTHQAASTLHPSPGWPARPETFQSAAGGSCAAPATRG